MPARGAEAGARDSSFAGEGQGLQGLSKAQPRSTASAAAFFLALPDSNG